MAATASTKEYLFFSILNFFGTHNISLSSSMAKRAFVLPPVTQIIPSQQPDWFQQMLGSSNQSNSTLPSAAILVDETPRTERGRYFRECDDARLRVIMRDYGPKLSPAKWQEVATKFGEGVTVRQIQDRWYNYAKPGLDRRPFTVMERRQVAALAIDHPGNWEWIARHLENGQNRSAAMVKHCGTNILPKLKKLGFEVECSEDIAFVPDAVFARRFPKGAVLDSLLAEYKEKKASHAAAREAATAREAASRAAAVPATVPATGPVLVIVQFGATWPAPVQNLLLRHPRK
jgi:hypothetical protein